MGGSRELGARVVSLLFVVPAFSLADRTSSNRLHLAAGSSRQLRQQYRSVLDLPTAGSLHAATSLHYAALAFTV